MRISRGYILFVCLFVAGLLQAQSDNAQFSVQDSLSSIFVSKTQGPSVLNSDTTLSYQSLIFNPQLDTLLVKEDSAKIVKQMRKEQRSLARANFLPDPNMSLWLGLTFPGAGQIYNRKYWKLPIIYGGAVGVAYAITYFGGYYGEYKQGYLDYTDTDPNTNSHLLLIPQGYPESNAGSYVKNQMDNYRRYRDIFIVVGVAVYALSVIDAYVDAQLAGFDISTDLSMKVRPKIDFEPHTSTPTAGCQMQIYF